MRTSGPAGVAGLIADALEALELEGVTLVGNDSGGAYSQIALAGHGERIGERVSRLVLTSCETPYDEWPPPPFDGLPRRPPTPRRWASSSARSRTRDPGAPAAYGLLLKHPIEPEVADSYALPASATGRSARRRQGDGGGLDGAGPRGGRAPDRDLGAPDHADLVERGEVFPLAHAERYAAALQRGAWSRSTTPTASPPRTGPTPSPRRSPHSRPSRVAAARAPAQPQPAPSPAGVDREEEQVEARRQRSDQPRPNPLPSAINQWRVSGPGGQ